MKKLFENLTWLCDESCSSRKSAEVFHVGSMCAGKIFDETWKIQKGCIESFYKTSMQPAKFSKTSKNFRRKTFKILQKFHKIFQDFLESFY